MNKVLNANDIIISHNIVVNRRTVTNIHFHDDCEIYYLLKGSTTYTIGDEIFYIRPGNFVFIPKGVIHKTDSENCLNNERFLINLNVDILDEEICRVLTKLCLEKVVYISKGDAIEIINTIEKIEREYASDEAFGLELIKHYISELFIMIYRKRTDYKPSLSDAEKTMQSVAEYISANYADEITLRGLSRRFAMSESYLSRKFKSVCGIGLIEYLTDVRITNAEKMLKSGEKSITEVAFKCGFNDSNYFSSVFKRLMGKSPHTLLNVTEKGFDAR